MYHIALINRENHLIEAAEALELEFSATSSARLLRYEAEARGDGWEVYGPADKPFAFPTAEEEATAEAASHRAELIAELSTLDARAIRPLRAVAAGTATQADRDTLSALEARAAEIREALA